MPNTVNRDFLVHVSGVRCPNPTTVVLWILGGAIMTGLTVKDVRPLLLDYFNDEENTQVRIKVRRDDDKDDGGGELARRPDVFLTVPLGSMNDNSLDLASLLKNLSKPDSPDSPHKLDTITNGFDCPQCRLITMLAQNRAVSDRWSLLNLSDPKSPRNFLPFVPLLVRSNPALFIFDESLNESDFRLHELGWNRPVIYTLISFLCNRTHAERDLILRSSTKFENQTWFDEENIDLDELYDKLVTYVCSFVQFFNASKQIDYKRCIDLYRNTSFALLESENLDQPQHSVYLRLPLNGTSIFQAMIPSHYFDSYLNQRQVRFRVSTENTAHGNPLDSMFLSSLDDLREGGRQVIVRITYSTHYNLIEARPRKLTTCYKESTKIDCEWNCRMRTLESICGCRSYLNRRSVASDDVGRSNNNSSSRYCSRTDYIRCSAEYLNASKDCSMKCIEPCRTTSYEWEIQKSLDLVDDEEHNYTFILTMVHKPRSYLEFVTSVKDSPENLISQVGGVLNFYLGISGLSIIFFLIYLFDVWRRWRRLRRDGGVGRGQDESRDGGSRDKLSDWLWKWRWMRAVESAATTDASTNGAVQQQISALMRRLESMEAENAKMQKRMDEKNEKMQQRMEEIDGKLTEMITAFREVRSNKLAEMGSQSLR